jgi:hypothetical protein
MVGKAGGQELSDKADNLLSRIGRQKIGSRLKQWFFALELGFSMRPLHHPVIIV